MWLAESKASAVERLNALPPEAPHPGKRLQIGTTNAAYSWRRPDCGRSLGAVDADTAESGIATWAPPLSQILVRQLEHCDRMRQLRSLMFQALSIHRHHGITVSSLQSPHRHYICAPSS